MNTIEKIISKPQYEFLKTNEHLKDRLLFLTFGGSHAYGTNTPDSDIDIRGCAFNNRSDLLGLGSFEHLVETETDTVIYSFRRFIGLLIKGNPSVIEMLGCLPEHYIFFHPLAQQLFDSSHLFMTRKLAESFTAYANNQLKRMKTTIVKTAVDKEKRESDILEIAKEALTDFNQNHKSFSHGTIELFLDEHCNNKEILMNVILKRYPLRDYHAMATKLGTMVRNLDTVKVIDEKKDASQLNKIAMHAIRTLLMAIDIFEKEQIITYRKDDLGLLAEIRAGKYLNKDGSYDQEFFRLAGYYRNKLKQSVEKSSLPDRPDYQRIEQLIISVNEVSLAYED